MEKIKQMSKLEENIDVTAKKGKIIKRGKILEL